MKTKTLLLLSLLVSCSASASEKLYIYAASSMTNVINVLIDNYESQHAVEVTPIYASSSALARQIERGAPADIFISANEKWMKHLIARSIVASDNVTPLVSNSLVVIAPVNSDKQLDINSIPQWTSILDGERLAIGNPQSVPAGIYAKEALESLGLWSSVKIHLAPSNNVRMALALVERSEVPLGIVYKTDAEMSSDVKIVAPLNEELYSSINYPVAQVSVSEASSSFYRYLLSAEAKAVFKTFGFK
ncbi:molybdate ABC transporter substrate-binding protein [Vibrio makurazakiensis]|uniref:molybdate ABC transporter substrate-binding protein n=1 Tax=Vibrio makurazakiensis TaxID=2910250 RepID=UPI003D0F062C